MRTLFTIILSLTFGFQPVLGDTTLTVTTTGVVINEQGEPEDGNPVTLYIGPERNIERPHKDKSSRGDMTDMSAVHGLFLIRKPGVDSGIRQLWVMVDDHTKNLYGQTPLIHPYKRLPTEIQYKIEIKVHLIPKATYKQVEVPGDLSAYATNYQIKVAAGEITLDEANLAVVEMTQLVGSRTDPPANVKEIHTALLRSLDPMLPPLSVASFDVFKQAFEGSPVVPLPDAPIPPNPQDGAMLVRIPQGEFLMGDDDNTYPKDKPKNNSPQHREKLSEYYIYKNLVTVAQFREFCRQKPYAYDWKHYEFRGMRDDDPMVNVTWEEARAYAQWAGGDLPTEAQWERAARGKDGRKYPWGDKFDSSKVWTSRSHTEGTGQVGKRGMTPEGISDMAGNAFQWCLDYYDKDYWFNRANSNAPKSQDPVNLVRSKDKVLRGGDWFASGEFECRSSYRGFHMSLMSEPTDETPVPVASHGDTIGFRCVLKKLP